MNPQTQSDVTLGDAITGAAGWAAALGTVTMALFPFAVPGIILAVAAVVPLLLLGLVLALVGAVLAAPVVAVRGLVRRRQDRQTGPADGARPVAPGGVAAACRAGEGRLTTQRGRAGRPAVRRSNQPTDGGAP